MWEHTKKQVECPLCRDPVSVIFTEFGKNDENRALKANIDQYNKAFVEQRSAYTMVSEMPFLIQKWLNSLKDCSNILRNKKRIFLLLTAIGYLISPLDILPELIFGIFGYIDDIVVVGSMLTAISHSFLRSIAERH